MKTLIALLTIAAIAPLTMAMPLLVDSVETEAQDELIEHDRVHELGAANFPPEELIAVVERETDFRPCQENPDDPDIPNIELSILNLTMQSWVELVYVADPETTLANDDGLVNGQLAFNIDNVGVNKPLVAEFGGVQPLVFEPFETWLFVIQDYGNTWAVAASAMGSRGLVGSFSVGDEMSSGSIIAVPEPATMGLIALGGAALLKRRRKPCLRP